MKNQQRRNGLLALSPMFLLILLFLGIGVASGDFYKVPMLIVFILLAAYSLSITRGVTFLERLHIFSRGAGNKSLLQMIWIFVLAGAFAESAQQMGAISSMVTLTLHYCSPQMLLVGLFVAACAVSLGIGTSVGTIVAIVPLAAALGEPSGISTPLLVSTVVGGALFGDNLSFISDTTVVATQTQDIAMRDKFRENVKVAIPAAVITAIIYTVIGLRQQPTPIVLDDCDWIKVVPYFYVIVAALCGMNVLVVLFTANIITGTIGVWCSDYTLQGWVGAMTSGVSNMGELILISMIAGGCLELIQHNGGISYLIYLMDRHIRSPKGAAFSIAILVCLVNLCTANNTIAILSVGSIAKSIASRYGVSPRRTASILDTFSCCTQGLLPYGAQLLMTGGIAAINPLTIIPYVYYPMILFVVSVIGIFLLRDSR